MKKHYFIFNIIAISLYALLVIGNLFISNGEYSEQENRYLQCTPKLSLETIINRSFMEDAENYSSDQMLYRDYFVATKAKCEEFIGKSENNGVYFADDRYLIEKAPDISNDIINSNIESIKAVSELNRFDVSVCIIPQAFEIHKDKLPKGAYNTNITKLTKTVSEKLKSSEVSIVETTKILEESKDKYIFYRTDHHQTSAGSYLVYTTLGKELGYTPLKESEFSIDNVSNDFFGTTYSKAPVSASGDIISVYKTKINQNAHVKFNGEEKENDSIFFPEHLNKKDKYSYFLDGNHSITIIKGGKKNGGTLAIFKDSYAHSISPFLINHFESIHLIDMRYYKDDPIQYLDENNISKVLFLYGSSTFMTDSSIGSVKAFAENSTFVRNGLVPESKPVDNSYFNDAVFLGDSLSVCLQSYSGLDNATFLCRTSMSVGGVFNMESDGTNLVEKTKAAKPKKIYVMLGVNELIVPENKETVMLKFDQLINQLKTDNPEARIYLQSILPYSKAKEEGGRIKNNVIYDYNESLLKMAEEKGIYYIDVYKAVTDKDNALRQDLTHDGVHMGEEGCKLWTNYLKSHAVITSEDAKTEHADNQKSASAFSNGDFDLEAICKMIQNSVTFEGDVGSTSPKALLSTHKINDDIIKNAIGYVGGGATAEEISLFEVKDIKEAEKVEQILKEYVSDRIKSFESYIPGEVPKLKNAIVYRNGKFIALVIAKDTGNTKDVLAGEVKPV